MFCCENDTESLDRINAGKLLMSWAIAAFEGMPLILGVN